MVSKKIKALIFFHLIVILSACSFGLNTCDCSGIRPFFRIESILLDTAHLDESSNKISIKNSYTLKQENFYLSLSYFSNFVVFEHKKVENPLISTAMACDCPSEGHLGLKEKISSITVRTIGQLDEMHPSGSVVNDIFSVKNNGQYQEISNFITDLREDKIGLNQQGVVFLLKTNDALITELFKVQSKKVQFSIEVKFESNLVLKAETKEATIIL
jgi:hypothetical protein